MQNKRLHSQPLAGHLLQGTNEALVKKPSQQETSLLYHHKMRQWLHVPFSKLLLPSNLIPPFSILLPTQIVAPKPAAFRRVSWILNFQLSNDCRFEHPSSCVFFAHQRRGQWSMGGFLGQSPATPCQIKNNKSHQGHFIAPLCSRKLIDDKYPLPTFVAHRGKTQLIFWASFFAYTKIMSLSIHFQVWSESIPISWFEWCDSKWTRTLQVDHKYWHWVFRLPSNDSQQQDSDYSCKPSFATTTGTGKGGQANMYMYMQPKWPLFWLEKVLFWRIDLQK